jgi:excisionase family DNA binding protein
MKNVLFSVGVLFYVVFGALVTVRQAAERLGLRKSSVNALILRGKLTAVHIGDSRNWFIDEAEIERYQQTRQKAGRPKIALKA